MAQRNRKNKTQINLSTITLELQTTAKPALTQETGRIAQPVITGFQRGIPRPTFLNLLQGKIILQHATSTHIKSLRESTAQKPTKPQKSKPSSGPQKN
jgi:hypothetical protein